ncbi:MAG: 30S ribosomal protein S6 [Oscillospiraceae bacterium]|jgi:small subunit ribosomal protein S6|nr:30S ribosomal protein S6 [Oscillospiraceae bacterium]
MPTVKGSYEAVFIFSLTLGEEGVAEIKEKFKSLIEQNAEIGEIDEWGKRRLAYLINDEADGFYVLYNFVSGPEFPAELDRVSKITDGVLRSMIIRKEETKEVVKKEEAKAEEK